MILAWYFAKIFCETTNVQIFSANLVRRFGYFIHSYRQSAVDRTRFERACSYKLIRQRTNRHHCVTVNILWIYTTVYRPYVSIQMVLSCRLIITLVTWIIDTIVHGPFLKSTPCSWINDTWLHCVRSGCVSLEYPLFLPSSAKAPT